MYRTTLGIPEYGSSTTLCKRSEGDDSNYFSINKRTTSQIYAIKVTCTIFRAHGPIDVFVSILQTRRRFGYRRRALFCTDRDPHGYTAYFVSSRRHPTNPSKARSWFLIFSAAAEKNSGREDAFTYEIFPVSNAFFSSRTRVWICLMEATFRLSALSSSVLRWIDATRFAGLLCSGTNAFLVFSKFELGTDAVSSPSLLFSQIHLNFRPVLRSARYIPHINININQNQPPPPPNNPITQYQAYHVFVSQVVIRAHKQL